MLSDGLSFPRIEIKTWQGSASAQHLYNVQCLYSEVAGGHLEGRVGKRGLGHRVHFGMVDGRINVGRGVVRAGTNTEVGGDSMLGRAQCLKQFYNAATRRVELPRVGSVSRSWRAATLVGEVSLRKISSVFRLVLRTLHC